MVSIGYFFACFWHLVFPRCVSWDTFEVDFLSHFQNFLLVTSFLLSLPIVKLLSTSTFEIDPVTQLSHKMLASQLTQDTLEYLICCFHHMDLVSGLASDSPGINTITHSRVRCMCSILSQLVRCVCICWTEQDRNKMTQDLVTRFKKIFYLYFMDTLIFPRNTIVCVRYFFARSAYNMFLR